MAKLVIDNQSSSVRGKLVIEITAIIVQDDVMNHKRFRKGLSQIASSCTSWALPSSVFIEWAYIYLYTEDKTYKYSFDIWERTSSINITILDGIHAPRIRVNNKQADARREVNNSDWCWWFGCCGNPEWALDGEC